MYCLKTNHPRFASVDYKIEYDKPCIPEKLELDIEMTHYGTGIHPNNHPLKGHIRFRNCENCSSDKVLVIYAHWCVSTHSGDAYWDYELICEDCQMFSQCSYAEND